MLTFSEDNICLKADTYKVSHWKQLPPNTTKIISYLESRGSVNPRYEGVVFFGLQYIIKKHLLGQQVTEEKINEAKEFFKEHFGQDIFNEEGWRYILEKYNGFLPIKIKAIPEGTYVKPLHNVLMIIENTDPNCAWLTGYLETLLLEIWYPITIATNSFTCKDIITNYFKVTSDDILNDFSLHDFGFRGVSSVETAGIGTMAHLTSFYGTDTTQGIIYANNYYNAGICGFSVPAAEHSTITSWGRDHEDDAIINMIKQFPTGIRSVVGDSYNIYDFCERISRDPIKSMILGSDIKFVVRPDSGDPVEVISKVIDILWNGFGGTFNSKHYKVLDSHIGILQGDGIDIEMIEKILIMLKNKRYSAENIVFGSGGGLLQKFDRDTLKFAIKCSAAVINENMVNVQKDPITSKTKKSKTGNLKLIPLFNTGEYHTISSTEDPKGFNSMFDSLEVIYKNGILVKEFTFSEIRERIDKYLKK